MIRDLEKRRAWSALSLCMGLAFWAAVLACVGLGAETPGPPPVLLTGQQLVLTPSGALSIFRDPSAKLTIQDVLAVPAREWFAPNRSDSPAFGFSADVFWLRFGLRCGAAEAMRAIIELRITRFEKLDWFVVRDGAIRETEAAGNLRPRTALRLQTRMPAFPVDLRPGEQVVVYLRAQTETSISFPLAVYSSFESFTDTLVRREAAGFAFGGVALAIFCLSLVFGFLMRNRLFFLSALVVTLLSLYFALQGGYWTWLRLPLASYMVRQPTLSVGMAMVFGVGIFTRVFCQDFFRPRWLSRTADGALLVLVALSVLILVLPFQTGNAVVMVASLGVLFCCILVAGWQFFFRKQISTRLVLAACLIDGLISVILQLQWYGRIPIWIPLPIGLMVFFVVTSILFLAASMDRLHQLLQGQVRTQKLERALAEARFRMLRYQLNPHFIFNALNSAIGLMRENPLRTSGFVFRLARFLRASLYHSSDLTVALSDELETLQAYLDIEKVRFEDRLDVVFAIQDDAKTCLVPELILQPLVENAIKHGMRPAPFVLSIHVRAARKGSILRLEVANTGHIETRAATGSQPAGIGISNLRERLEMVYRGQETLSLSEEEGWVIARIRLPFASCPDDSPRLYEPSQAESQPEN